MVFCSLYVLILAWCLQTAASVLDRPKITVRASGSGNDDVSGEIEKAIRQANNGGTVVFESGKKYVVGKKLDLMGLKDVWVQLDGDIKFTDDMHYWRKNNIAHPFQRTISFWRWGGENIKIFGRGSIDGSGQKWWDDVDGGKDILDSSNDKLRPVLFMLQNAKNFEINGIKFLDSPAWFTFIVDSKQITFDHCTFSAKSRSRSRPRNTDGFDTYNVDGMRIANSNFKVDDDCFAAKPNTTNVLIENLHCDGSHGVSMGSIGQYRGVMDYITNVHVRNVTLVNGQNGARIKSWAGSNKGYGYVRNITFEDLKIQNTDHPIVVDTCYQNVKPADCAAHPSQVKISDVLFKNIHGSSSGKKGDVIASLICSPSAPCTNIKLQNVSIRGSVGEGRVVCEGIKGGVGMRCSP